MPSLNSLNPSKWILSLLNLKTATKAVFIGVLCTLIAAGWIEKYYGTTFTYTHLYGATWFVGLWALLVATGVAWLCVSNMQRRPLTFLLHLAFVVILGGALVTHLWGKQGKLYLPKSHAEHLFVTGQGDTLALPFELRLEHFQIDYYPGSRTPMDFTSHLKIDTPNGPYRGTASMNHVFSYRHYRFYQIGYNENGTFLSVAYDPMGIAVTYTGYALLWLTLLLFPLDRHSQFRRLLRHPLLRSTAPLFVALFLCCSCQEPTPPTVHTLPQEVAARYGQLYCLYNDRICPLSTPAEQLLVKLYGRSSYHGYTAEQVFTGCFYYFDDWRRVPFLHIKSPRVRQVLHLSTAYASLNDFTQRDTYEAYTALLEAAQRGDLGPEGKGVLEADEKFRLASMMVTGALLKIYPYAAPHAPMEWFAPTDNYPATVSTDKRIFMRKMLNFIGESIAQKDFVRTRELLDKLQTYQQKEAAGQLPSAYKMAAEQYYHRLPSTRSIALLALLLGIWGLTAYWRSGRPSTACSPATQCPLRRKGPFLRYLLSVLLWLYLLAALSLRTYISGHLPMANGYETMQFLAFLIMTIAVTGYRRIRLLLPAGLFLTGWVLLVSMLGETNPAVTPLLPVLASPLLSVHVATIMIAYGLFSFMMMCGVSGLFFLRVAHQPSEAERLMVISRLLLYTALCFLLFGMFIGAIWANQSWGRYWGWDPKETWALITMLVYSIPIHAHTFPRLQKSLYYHLFTVVAYFSVLITYFGVNFFLGGLHSYA